MSLINDALRKAKQTQPPASRPALVPPMRPVEPTGKPEDHSLFSLPFLITVLVVLAGFLVFSFGSEPAMQVRARSHRPAPPTPTAPTPVATTPQIPTNAIVADTNGPAANAAVPADPPKPQPFSYKLQGIVFNPKHPSAVINGHDVFVGERVGDARVTAITRESVTIVTLKGETSVLDLFH